MRHVSMTFLLITLISAESVWAARFYVQPNGDDGADGRSHSTAWKTINKVNRYAFKPGDDVYLLAGGRWKSQLVVDWNGTATNRVVVGSYYMNNGVETIGVKSGAKRPTLVGGYPQVSKIENGRIVPVKGAVPNSPYAGLVLVSANYVTVQNLRVEKSSGSGITLNKAFHHAIFENNVSDLSAGSSILFTRKTHSNIMRNNTMRKCAYAWKEKIWIGRTWPICNGAVGSRGNLIENNMVTESYGEGIVAYDVGANNNVIKGNTVVVIRSVGIYVDNGANNTIESNLVVGDSTGDGNKGSAFALNVEDYPIMNDAIGNIFRNNLAANTGICFWIGMEPKARADGFKVGVDFIGNTCVHTEKTIGYFPTANQAEKVHIANNIFYGAAKDGCSFPVSSKIIFNNNLWQSPPTQPGCQGSNDVIANPSLAKTAGWQNTGPNSIPKVTDFALLPGSPAAKQGKAHANLPTDYFRTMRPARPSLGAIEIGGSKAAPSPPQGLVVNVSPNQ